MSGSEGGRGRMKSGVKQVEVAEQSSWRRRWQREEAGCRRRRWQSELRGAEVGGWGFEEGRMRGMGGHMSNPKRKTAKHPNAAQTHRTRPSARSPKTQTSNHPHAHAAETHRTRASARSPTTQAHGPPTRCATDLQTAGGLPPAPVETVSDHLRSPNFRF